MEKRDKTGVLDWVWRHDGFPPFPILEDIPSASTNDKVLKKDKCKCYLQLVRLVVAGWLVGWLVGWFPLHISRS